MLEASTSEPNRSTPHLTIEMCGQNIVIRPTAPIDQGYTVALTDAVNAAAVTDTVVIIDPESVRCDDAFAGDEHATPDRGARITTSVSLSTPKWSTAE